MIIGRRCLLNYRYFIINGTEYYRWCILSYYTSFTVSTVLLPGTGTSSGS